LADIGYSQLFGKNGTEDGSPTVNLVNAARGAVCSLYRSSPLALSTGRGFPDPTGFGSALSSMYDHMCSDKPLPPPPAKKNPNGQCPGTIYKVKYQYSGYGFSPQTGEFNAAGPIGNVEYRTSNDGNYGPGFEYGTGNPRTFFFITSVGQNSTSFEKGALKGEITKIEVINGPDNCGGAYPYYPELPLPPGGYNPTVPYNDRGSNRDVDVKIVPYVIPVGVQVAVQPHITVKVGAVNIIFDLSGATLAPVLNVGPFNFAGGSDTQPNPNPPETPSPGIDPIALADRFDAIDQALKALKECACPDTSTLQVNQIAAGAQSYSYSPLSIDRNRYCAIALTQVPVNAKKQYGGFAPDVIYAGWAWFSGPGGYLSERMPVDSIGKVFKNDGHYNTFHFTLNKGFLCDAYELNVPLAQ